MGVSIGPSVRAASEAARDLRDEIQEYCEWIRIEGVIDSKIGRARRVSISLIPSVTFISVGHFHAIEASAVDQHLESLLQFGDRRIRRARSGEWNRHTKDLVWLGVGVTLAIINPTDGDIDARFESS